METKVCCRCRKSKPFSDFQRNRRIKDGYDIYCRKCNSERRRLRYLSNPDKWREKGRQYYWRNRDRILTKTRENQRVNAGHIKERKHNWRIRNLAKCRELDAKYRKDNKRWVGLLSTCWQRGKEKNITRIEFNNWFDSTPKVCAYCGQPLEGRNLTIDRMNNEKPYEIGNIALACHKCNRIKSDVFSYEEFMEIMERYIKPKLRVGFVW